MGFHPRNGKRLGNSICPVARRDQLRRKRYGQAGRSWYVDETYIKVHGKWCYLYRAIDHDGNLVDSMLSEKRNMEAAKRFFKQAVAVVGATPQQVTTDGHARLSTSNT
jgi:putative transposase